MSPLVGGLDREGASGSGCHSTCLQLEIWQGCMQEPACVRRLCDDLPAIAVWLCCCCLSLFTASFFFFPRLCLFICPPPSTANSATMAAATAGGSDRPATVVGMGEAMLRFAPLPYDKALPCPEDGAFLRSVGGDELNVCVATSRLAASPGTVAQWISVLPTGPLGDVIAQGARNAGVGLDYTKRIEGAECGTFFVLPEQKTVHYQRRNSAFAQQAPNLFDWPKVFSELHASGPVWLHMTGITPMISPKSRLAWTQALEAAHRLNIPVSVDFNHRKQLGPLGDLWTVMCPQLSKLQVMIVSVTSLKEIAELEGVGNLVPQNSVPLQDPAWRVFQAHMRLRWGLKRLAVCYKTRDESGLQRRWSAVASASGIHTTVDIPVYHRPKDECGGGSAWAAGIIDSLQTHWHKEEVDGDHFKDVNDPGSVKDLRRADLLAALCQETIGDHSTVTREKLLSYEQGNENRPLTIDASQSHQDKILETLATLKKSGILAIIRAKNADAAIARGIELCSLGCRAIEVTLDTTDWKRVLGELVQKLPADVCVGVGTVMDDTVFELPEIAALGGRFALSPINPTGFIDACHAVGLLAVPSGLSSNELWDLHRQGAHVVKMFHAGQVTPKILKSMLGVSPLRALNVAPSGGVTPDNAEDWWDAGACTVGMGSNLAGKDITFAFDTPEYEKAKRDWEQTGLANAKQLFEKVAARFPTDSAQQE
eukprot:m.18593 g.18593  ORF g.18593 m.18593 type:complete len:709 (+) comp5752_c0_seq2:2506-4632(+)